MKTFEDLEFKEHEVARFFSSQAVMCFENNYGVSVINGAGAYCGKDTFEVAILFDNEITYNSGITSDVLTHQSKEEICLIMKKVQEL